MGWRFVLASGFARRMCNSPASPILANELHTRHPNPHFELFLGTMLDVNSLIKALTGKAFSYAIIGEADEKAFPARADS